MKQVFILSGIGALVMTLLVVTGTMQLNARTQNVIDKGNKSYAIEDYETAKEWYNKGIEGKANQPIIHYNLGLVDYVTKNYEQAAENLSKAEDNVMVLGNAFYRQGRSQQDINQQLAMYQQGLEQYLKGIKNDPYDVELKYNYEFLKKLIEDIQEQQKQEQQDQEKENQDGEDQENQDQKDQDGESQDGENQDQENQDQKDQNGENQDQKQQNQEGQNQEDQKEEDQAGDNQEDQNEKDAEEQQDQNKAGENEEQGNSAQLQDADREAIEQVLKMLEQQEEQSLKNNQAVMNQGKEEANDW